MSRATLDASVTSLSSSRAEFPSADEGIAIWREDQGGVFDVPLADIADFLAAALRRAAAPRQP